MRIEIMTAIAIMAAATFFTRFLSPAVLGKVGIAPWAGRFLKHVPTAMFTALIAPSLLAPHGLLEITWTNHYLIAGLVAAFMAYRRFPPVVTMGSGMAVMLVLRGLVP